jgi:hypothetical protein
MKPVADSAPSPTGHVAVVQLGLATADGLVLVQLDASSAWFIARALGGAFGLLEGFEPKFLEKYRNTP